MAGKGNARGRGRPKKALQVVDETPMGIRVEKVGSVVEKVVEAVAMNDKATELGEGKDDDSTRDNPGPSKAPGNEKSNEKSRKKKKPKRKKPNSDDSDESVDCYDSESDSDSDGGAR